MNRNISKLIKIFLFIAIIAITDKVLGLILHNLYFSQTAGENHSLNYVLSDCKADVIIFGNSRAQHHYDPRIISKRLNMSCYNAGQDGGHSILLSYAQIKILLEHCLPKIIILELSLDGIANYPGMYDRLSILLPYYSDYPEIRSLIRLRSPYESIKLMSAIYPYNSDIINIIRFNTNYESDHKFDYDGYVPLKGEINTKMLTSNHKIARPLVVDTNLKNALENTINLCKEKGVSLFIVDSPKFLTVNKEQNPLTAAEKLTIEIIHRNQVNYLDFSNDSAFAGHFELFDDLVHLNDKGAKMFSNMLIDRLDNSIEK